MENNDSSEKWPELSAAKRALLQQRLRAKPTAAAPAGAKGITRRAAREHAPLSFDQQQTLSIIQTHSVPSAYLGSALYFKGEIDTAVLRQALTEIVRRHESLRTTFETRDGQPVQVIGSPQPYDFPVIDLTDSADAVREERAREVAGEQLKRPFDLVRGPLLRVVVIRLRADEYVLVLAIDHMVSDFISMGLFMNELGVLYESFSRSLPSPLPEPPVQFGDWVEWQRRSVDGGELDTQFSYWRERLDGCPPLLSLPCARPRPALRTFEGASQSLMLPLALTDELRELSRRQMVGLYTTLLAAFNVLVHHYTGREDIVLGRGIPGRTRAEVEGLIGCFVNLLALRTKLSGELTFLDLLKRVRDVVNGAYAHQDVPFVKLVERLLPETDTAYPPLVQLIFNLYTLPEMRPSESVDIRPFDLGAHQPKDDMALFQDAIIGLKDTGRNILAEAVYNRQVYDAGAMAGMLADYRNLLEAVVLEPGARVDDLIAVLRGRAHQ